MFARCTLVLFLLAGFAPVHATIYKVGPGGTHATIQAAIDAALANPGNDEIRVHTGTYAESIHVPETMTADQLDIVGGYSDGYSLTVRNGAALTIIDPPDGSRAVDFRPAGGLLQLESVTMSGANAKSCAGFLLGPGGDAQVVIAFSFVTDNVADSAGTGIALGGGGCLEPGGSAIALVYRSTVARNTARATGVNAGAEGAGVYVYCAEQAQCGVEGSQISQNRLEPQAGQADGAGVYVHATASSLAVISASDFSAQEVGGTPTASVGIAVEISADGSAQAEVTRSLFRGSGAVPGGNAEELRVGGSGTSKVFVDNSVIAHSGLRSLRAKAFEGGALSLLQLTLSDNAYAADIDGAGSVAVLVYDDVFHGVDAGVALAGLVAAQHNLLGTDPLFVAPSLFDYSLRGSGSPALNAGSDTLPVGTLDASGAERVQDGVVDIGAYENSDRVFATRFDD